MSNKVIVAGVGMVPFATPKNSDAYDVMGIAAIEAALKDAGIDYDKVGQVYAGYVYGDSTAGQQVVYKAGLSGVPVLNVNNNCASGSSALFLARQAVETGAVDIALAVGFEQMNPGALGRVFHDRQNVMEKHLETLARVQGWQKDIPPAVQFFGGAGREYQEKYGASDETFAMISVKARKHAANNPYSVFRDPLTLEEVLESPHIYGPVTRYQCCPPTCGAAAAVLCSPAMAKKLGLTNKVQITAQTMTTDTEASFGDSIISLVGYDMGKAAAHQVYEMAGIGPDEIDVVELHDCFTVNELLTYEALGLAPEGGAEKFIQDGGNTYGGKVVTNPSGGLLSKGHPLGATGLAQCAELVWQLRGQAEKRQIENVRFGLQHNIGLGGACVVSLFERAE